MPLFGAAAVAVSDANVHHEPGSMFAVALAVSGAYALNFAAPLALTGATPWLLAGAVFLVGDGISAGTSVVTFGILAIYTFLIAGLYAGAVKYQLMGLFLSLFSVAMFVASLAAPPVLASHGSWNVVGPILLFLGLLTLINTPFDWASLGLTRALLRRGLELGGWWPYLLAFADAALAAVIVAALALTMVVSVQAFDALATHGGGMAILPLDDLFDGIAAHSTDPEYWWVYALLLSTVLPSMINLMIGGASLLRGLPGLPIVIWRRLPLGKAVPNFDRSWIALVLTLQIAGGAFLGVAAQALLVVVIIGYVMPWFGLGLLDMARDVAAFNLPMRLARLFGMSL